MNWTKIAPLVLICVVALGVISGVGLALGLGPISPTGDPIDNPKPNAKPMGDPINDPRPNYRPMGDPINDPRPNHS